MIQDRPTVPLLETAGLGVEYLNTVSRKLIAEEVTVIARLTHEYFPGRLYLESRLSQETVKQLAQRGHEVAVWPDWTWRAGAVCSLLANLETGLLTGGTDPRRPSYASGW